MLETLSRTQRELRESEALYRSLVDQSPDVITVHRRGEILFTNPAGVKVLGAKSAEELVGKQITDIVPMPDRERVSRGLEQMQSIHEPTPLIQQTMHRLDGTSFEAEFRAIPIVYAGEPAIQFVMHDITGRKRLEEQWNKFKLGIESSNEAVFMTDVDGTIRYINPAFERMYGYSWDEAVGKTPRLLKSGVLSSEVYQHFWGTLLAKGTVKGELVNRTKDGRLINVEGSANPILDDGGKLLGFLAVQRDISERKQAEEALRLSEERFRSLYENSTLGMYRTSPDGKILLCNPSLVKMLGYSSFEELAQRNLEQEGYEPGYERNAFRQRIETDGEVRGLETAWTKKDGSRIYIRESAKVIRDAGGRILYYEGTVEDISERKHAEEKIKQLLAEVERQKCELEIRVEQRTAELHALNLRLKEELSERQRLLQSLHDREGQLAQAATLAKIAYWALDLRTSEFTFNDQFYHVLRTTAERAGGYVIPAERFIQQFVHPEDVDHIRERMQSARRPTSATGQLEYRSICGDGQIQDVLLEYQLVFDELGCPIGVIGVHMDITDRKQTVVALQQAIELAEAASRSKSEFLSRMSHELRTPMNAILGFAQLLEMSRKEPLTPAQKERVKQIVKGGQHLLDLINEILDISRIEANRLQISPEPVSIRESIQEVIDLTMPLAAKHQIHLVTAFDGIDLNSFVMADRQRLKQVLLNLLGNAVKYNFDGGSVFVACQQAGSKGWRIAITDTGPGISQENLGRLFMPFERLVTDQSNVEGTGLGLTLAKRLVELMHGQIGVESTVGGGSTFWIELPQAESQLSRLQRTRSTGELPEISVAARTILYIEDNVANYELIQQVLAENSQVSLLWATEPRAGIESARQHHPDLILLDLHLGGRDGAEVLQQLKQQEGTAGIPVVMVSADATPGQVKRMLDLGAHSYLTKPLDVKRFIQLIEELLGAKER
jgi:PAS domain S-box-containing protein